MRPLPAGALGLRKALLLGAVQGPAELLPISSSAHLRILGARDKADEVAPHLGTALALLAGRPQVRPWFAALTVAPPAAAAVLAQRVVEERLGGGRPVACGLVAGSVALWVAEGLGGTRSASDARPADAVAIGLAQASALWPGVSRAAATLAVARARGFTPAAAAELSREALLPVLVAATVRVAGRLRRAHVAPAATAALATAAAQRLLGPPRRLRPYALYRLAVAVLAVWQDRSR